ncbi:MAG: threonine/serine dehydratase [Eggerthellaceae bacterium]|nr:threonine/serine dehydratase [Eggerthellaceae bacterium]
MGMTHVTIQEARARIAPYITRTPLLRLRALDEYLGCEVYAKPECLQVTGSFKYRGAMNKILSLSDDQLQRGIVAASSGNHGKAVAYAARMLGVKATIVLPHTAAQVKVDTIQKWGAEVVRCELAERFEVAQRIADETGGAIVPPFNDKAIMAGQGTAGLEIAEDCPDLDAVVIPVSGGGLIGGVSCALKATLPKAKVYGAEPAALPRWTASLAAGQPTSVEKKATVADALVSLIPGDACFPYVAQNVDAFAAVDEEFILKGTKLIVSEGKLVCEPSSGIGAGAILQGLIPVSETDKLCLFVSGGSVSLEQLGNL